MYGPIGHIDGKFLGRWKIANCIAFFVYFKLNSRMGAAFVSDHLQLVLWVAVGTVAFTEQPCRTGILFPFVKLCLTVKAFGVWAIVHLVSPSCRAMTRT